MSSNQDPKIIFGEALALPDAALRAAHLDRACADAPDLRREVESLLQAHEQAANFLRLPPPSPEPAQERPSDRIGRYKLLEQIGAGGFGEVWMAEQEEPVRRRVALKIIKLGMNTKEVVARFEAERQALALMNHPHIATVFDGGATATGRPYFVMELVKGVPITDYCDAHKLSTRARLELFIQVCHAVQHAHQKGIIHRDLKPSNILVTVQDDRPVPKVIDFGVAKATQARLTEKTVFTRFHQWIGTPAYMSPEQAGLANHDVDTRSDVYSLGVLLYELLTGRTPFDTQKLLEAGYEAVMRTIREEQPPKPSTQLSTLAQVELAEVAARRGAEPSKLGRSVRGDLDWIAMKALEKDRKRRYETANNLAQDVARHVGGEPVSAGPPGAVYRMRKFASRNKLLVSASATVTLALALGFTVSAWQWRRAETARLREALQRQAAEAQTREKRAQLVRIDVANGARSLDAMDWFGALLWFTEALRQDTPGSQAEAMQRQRIGAMLQYLPRLTQVWTHGGSILSAAFGPGGGQALTASADGTARLWDVPSGRPGLVFPCGASVSEALFSDDGRRVVTFSRNDLAPVRVWDTGTGQPACPPLEHEYWLNRVLIDTVGQRVYTLGDPNNRQQKFSGVPPEFKPPFGAIRIWDASTGRQIRQFSRMNDFRWIQDIALSPDGQWLATALDSSVVVWNLRKPCALYFLNATAAHAVVATGLKPDAQEGYMEEQLPDLTPPVVIDFLKTASWATCVAFSQDMNRLLIGCSDGSGCIRSLPDGMPMLLHAPKPLLNSNLDNAPHFGAFTPGGQHAVLAMDDGTVRLWDARTGELEMQWKKKSLSLPVFSPDGRLVFLAGQVWDIGARRPISPGPLHFESNCAAFSPDGMSILTGGADGTVRLWNLAGAIPTLQPLRHAADASQSAGVSQKTAGDFWRTLTEMRQAQFSPDGRLVLTVGDNGSARVWDSRSGAAITPIVSLDVPLIAGAFSLDAARFAIFGGINNNGLGRVWDTGSGRPTSPVMHFPECPLALSFSPDGNWLVASTQRGAHVRDARTGERIDWPPLAGRHLFGIDISADGHRVAISSGTMPASADNPAPSLAPDWRTQIYDPTTWQPRTPPLDETNQVRELFFSPDGRWLLTLAASPKANWFRDFNFAASVRLWDSSTGRPVSPVFQGYVDQAMYTRDSRHLFVLRYRGDPLVWELPACRLAAPSKWGGLKYGGSIRMGVGEPQWMGLKTGRLVLAVDGEKVATIGECEIALFDARTGEPLAPRLGEGGDYRHAQLEFNRAGDMLAVVAGDRTQLWPLPKDTRPIGDLTMIAELLAGRTLGASGAFDEQSAEAAMHSWQILREKYPATFAAAPVQMREWHECAAAASEKAQNWFAASFHLDRLAQDNPNDPAVRLRRASARNRAAMEALGGTSSPAQRNQ